ncbi:phytoene desaturase family protein [Thermoflavifilum thermophilum]|uniref:Phytoene desaturase n=1 Tax=Thermoflavifilum thermophilum TaxID=1393122 RepID=A0A1I7N7T0_9BACT|nr:phytoene desaturase family protein [Thermoflavifilum thermophilum]SFV30699.1 phytoene desaturase [Thermoflavifilum thermophilum]
MAKRISIIGSGFAGLAASCFLAREGFEVEVFEALDGPGGRAGLWEAEDFRFDMGPSWYWMPDIFERFFQRFQHQPSDFYELIRLNPSYRIFWEDGFTDIPADNKALAALFESWEPGSSKALQQYLKEAAWKYEVGMKKFAYKPGLSWMEFMDRDVWQALGKLDLLHSIHHHVARHFNHPRIRQIMEFPVQFLGALPQETPALYSLMNYADIVLGTWYPMGGIYRVVEALYALAQAAGVKFHFGTPVQQIRIEGKKAVGLVTSKGETNADAVLATADYHHVEQQLLPAEVRQYRETYWQTRQLSPSCLLYYLGINRRVSGLLHHNLFFDADFDRHAAEIYKNPAWPSRPLFYVCAPSITDPNVAPPGNENLFVLIPIAVELEGDDEPRREAYLQQVLNRLQRVTGIDLSGHIRYCKTLGPRDFVNRYHAYKGNAYGLANTLRQTAVLKPRMRSKRVENLFFAGQLTAPGPGMPAALISGELAATLATNYLHKLL